MSRLRLTVGLSQRRLLQIDLDDVSLDAALFQEFIDRCVIDAAALDRDPTTQVAGIHTNVTKRLAAWLPVGARVGGGSVNTIVAAGGGALDANVMVEDVELAISALNLVRLNFGAGAGSGAVSAPATQLTTGHGESAFDVQTAKAKLDSDGNGSVVARLIVHKAAADLIESDVGSAVAKKLVRSNDPVLLEIPCRDFKVLFSKASLHVPRHGALDSVAHFLLGHLRAKGDQVGLKLGPAFVGVALPGKALIPRGPNEQSQGGLDVKKLLQHYLPRLPGT